MRLIGKRGLAPVELDGLTEVVLTSDAGTPLALAVEVQPGHWVVKHVGEDRERFLQALRGLGLAVGPVAVRPLDGPRILT